MGRSVSVPRHALDVAYVQSPDHEFTFTWDYMIDDLRAALNKRFQSVVHQNTWLSSEEHVIAGNSLALFGVSEYCGLTAIWIVAAVDNERYNLAENWVSQISKGFHQVVRDYFGTEYAKVSTASNGEAFFKELNQEAKERAS